MTYEEYEKMIEEMPCKEKPGEGIPLEEYLHCYGGTSEMIINNSKKEK